MKKTIFLVILVAVFAISASNGFARGIGGKLIYNSMMDDYSDAEAENNISGGIFFDAGPFLIKELTFKPGIDYVKIEGENWKYAEVWGIHLDWYWYFMDKKEWAPFLGFGPALNYYQFNDDESDGDSDAGIEIFGGVEYKLNSQWSLIGELRITKHDIADLDKTIFKPSIGACYFF